MGDMTLPTAVYFVACGGAALILCGVVTTYRESCRKRALRRLKRRILSDRQRDALHRSDLEATSNYYEEEIKAVREKYFRELSLRCKQMQGEAMGEREQLAA